MFSLGHILAGFATECVMKEMVYEHKLDANDEELCYCLDNTWWGNDTSVLDTLRPRTGPIFM